MKRIYQFILASFLLLPFSAAAQDDLLALADADSAVTSDFTTATFKTTRIINGHSVQTIPGKELLFMISHRFGTLDGGAYNFFGLDAATIRLALEYGLTDRFSVGVGRSSLEKTYDGYLKYKLLRQKEGTWAAPVTVTGFASTAITTLRYDNAEKNEDFSSRLAYTYQLLIARKFNDRFSLQLSPTLVHRNLVTTTRDENNVYAIGAGSRYKLTKRTSFNAEYFYLLPGATADDYINSFSLGFDIETGGHVFQLHLTNAQGMIEKFFIPQTAGKWGDGGIYFGFNISRVFSFDKDKKVEKKW
ncbi:hypothetical protein AAE02nite_36150 [Adhaeribacter aerolatus]|uniref:DUF5777 domain-containing protein n=1 Tax=Adhaeribacter aerolatus TaxID=670289 RepID=A0A512B1W7_9BACT|nr:DUF5777 family beta-barrel protein [Adhaeribacter aerolatus]GEO05951.1 hypothetical protein AAE02nite_36150 [Adhaeribacter aerolatus]